VITVRDYVRSDLNKYLLNVPHTELTIKPFEDKQITEIVNKSLPEGKSLDALTIDGINLISKGNSRIALMAVSSLLLNPDKSILKNVFSIYEQYFQNVKIDLSFLNETENIKALGILSFFGVLDRRNVEVQEILERHFNINWDELWENFIELEKVELVDVFHKEAAKVSDQVLATYVFYKTFIDEKSASINYSDWIGVFIEKFEKKINSTLIDIINTFGFNELKDRVTTLIINVQKKIENNRNKLYTFYKLFWFFKEVDTLLFIRNWINELEAEKTELSDIKFNYEANDFPSASEYLGLLINFWRHNTIFTHESIDLGLLLIFKQPSRIPEVLKFLSENFAYQRFDFRFGYPRQKTLFETLDEKKFNEREKAISDQLFLSIAPSFLGWEFHQFESRGGGQMMIYTFSLVKTLPLMDLRKKILERMFNLFNDNKDKVLAAINKCICFSRMSDSSIYSDEQRIITDFFIKNLKPENYSHCKLVYGYVETLKEHNVELINDWNLFLDSDSMQIAKIFSPNFDDDKLSYREQEQRQRDKIKNFMTGRDIEFVESTFKSIDLIYKEATIYRDEFGFDMSLSYLFQALAETNTKLYYKSLELMMLGTYSFELVYGNIIFYPIRMKLVEPKELYKHLNRYEYKQKQYWKQMFFEAIEEDEIDEFILQEFIGFIFSLSDRFHINEFDKYIKFDKQFHASQSLLPPKASVHNNILTYLTEILLSKVKNTDITFDYSICEKCSKYFSEKISLLKDVFYLHKKRNAHYDYDGKEMAAVSALDHFFLIEYISEITKDLTYIEFRFDKLNISFVWDLPEYEEILDKALEIIIAKAPIFSNFEHQANVFFKGLKLSKEQFNKVYSYIGRFISKNRLSKQHILIILNVVTYNFNDQFMRFLKEFLLLNNDVEFMYELSLERFESFTGSRVPRIEGHITLVKSIIEMIRTLPNPLDYSEHLKYWEENIEWAKKDKQAELKRDFTGWID
jgi:hypothetical protein